MRLLKGLFEYSFSWWMVIGLIFIAPVYEYSVLLAVIQLILIVVVQSIANAYFKKENK